MIKRILVVLSGTPYTRAAIQHAVELAQRHRARVTGVAILDRKGAAQRRLVRAGAASEKPPGDRGVGLLEGRIDAAVSEFEETARRSGIVHRVIRAEGDPIEALCKAWRYQDLMLVGLRGLFDYGVLAEPKDALLRLITSGVRPILAVSSEYVPIHRVLVAYSGSPESAKAMKRFVQLRLWPDATTGLLHYIEGDEPEDEYKGLLAETAGYCRDWGVELDVKAEVGGPRDHLLSDARDREADLIVMGDSARSLLTRRLFGDTALHVIRNADRPLFLSH
jgi:nucleotide-binding universal stress UspA family protein